MAFEGQGSEAGWGLSPGGFEIGVVGWVWGQPIPKSITFFLDGSAMMCDQYGRHIRRAILPDGSEVRFADTPPDANQDGTVVPRRQFATHAQVIAALTAERIDWLSYEVRYRSKDGNRRMHGNLTLEAAQKLQEKLLREGNGAVELSRTIACAGWPQLPYEELKKLSELPPTPITELRKIKDPALRKDALRIKSEWEEAQARELQATE